MREKMARYFYLKWIFVFSLLVVVSIFVFTVGLFKFSDIEKKNDKTFSSPVASIVTETKKFGIYFIYRNPSKSQKLKVVLYDTEKREVVEQANLSFSQNLVTDFYRPIFYTPKSKNIVFLTVGQNSYGNCYPKEACFHVMAINTQTMKSKLLYSLMDSPSLFTVDQDNGFAYISESKSPFEEVDILKFNVETGNLQDTISLPQNDVYYNFSDAKLSENGDDLYIPTSPLVDKKTKKINSITLISLSSGNSRVIHLPQIFDGQNHLQTFAFSPNRRYLSVSETQASGPDGIMIFDIRNEQVLTTKYEQLHNLRGIWSGDSSKVTFLNGNGSLNFSTNDAIWSASTRIIPSNAVFSPDSKWIYADDGGNFVFTTHEGGSDLKLPPLELGDELIGVGYYNL